MPTSAKLLRFPAKQPADLSDHLRLLRESVEAQRIAYRKGVEELARSLLDAAGLPHVRILSIEDLDGGELQVRLKIGGAA